MIYITYLLRAAKGLNFGWVFYLAPSRTNPSLTPLRRIKFLVKRQLIASKNDLNFIYIIELLIYINPIRLHKLNEQIIQFMQNNYPKIGIICFLLKMFTETWLVLH